jgi:hypothetical protein
MALSVLMCQGCCDIDWVLLLSADSSEDHMGDRGALWAEHLQYLQPDQTQFSDMFEQLCSFPASIASLTPLVQTPAGPAAVHARLQLSRIGCKLQQHILMISTSVPLQTWPIGSSRVWIGSSNC